MTPLRQTISYAVRGGSHCPVHYEAHRERETDGCEPGAVSRHAECKQELWIRIRHGNDDRQSG